MTENRETYLLIPEQVAHGAGVDKKSERTAEYVEAHRAHTEHANYLKNDKSPTTMAEVETRGTGARR